MVRADADWDQALHKRGSGEPFRFVLIAVDGSWELRLGESSLHAVTSNTGGTHRHMFSIAEATAADALEAPVRAGWLYEILSTHIEFS